MYRLLCITTKVATFIVHALLQGVSKASGVANAANRKARVVRSERAHDRLRAANVAAIVARENLSKESIAFAAEVRAINQAHA